MPTPLARTVVALDASRVVRPSATADWDQPDIVRDWLAHLEAGRLGPAARPAADGGDGDATGEGRQARTL